MNFVQRSCSKMLGIANNAITNIYDALISNVQGFSRVNDQYTMKSLARSKCCIVQSFQEIMQISEQESYCKSTKNRVNSLLALTSYCNTGNEVCNNVETGEKAFNSCKRTSRLIKMNANYLQTSDERIFVLGAKSGAPTRTRIHTKKKIGAELGFEPKTSYK